MIYARLYAGRHEIGKNYLNISDFILEMDEISIVAVGPQVQKLRNMRGWTLIVLGRKPQLDGWSVSPDFGRAILSSNCWG
jgi:hypothetical protein